MSVNRHQQSSLLALRTVELLVDNLGKVLCSRNMSQSRVPPRPGLRLSISHGKHHSVPSIHSGGDIIRGNYRI